MGGSCASSQGDCKPVACANFKLTVWFYSNHKFLLALFHSDVKLFMMSAAPGKRYQYAYYYFYHYYYSYYSHFIALWNGFIWSEIMIDHIIFSHKQLQNKNTRLINSVRLRFKKCITNRGFKYLQMAIYANCFF